jgi:diguanylate cyclase (GGDEF)-like protein
MIAACSFVPMIVFGAPAYPVDWFQATLLVVVTCSVAGALATVNRVTWRLTAAFREQALLDDLTGLLNRRGWQEAAERALACARRANCHVAVVAIDLDGLKELNDTMGHDEGDRLIRETARRLRPAFREEDIIARLGGDEFSLLLLDAEADEMLNALERLRAVTPASGAFSAGVALGPAIETLADLQRRADLALYEAKHHGGDRSCVAPDWETSRIAALTQVGVRGAA